MNDIAMVALTPVATFTSTFLRGFQQKAVATNNKKQAFIVGSTMNACDVLVIASVAVHATAWLLLVSALGAGCDWLAGMSVHDRLNRKRRQAIKEQKRLKRERRIIRVATRVLEDRGIS